MSQSDEHRDQKTEKTNKTTKAKKLEKQDAFVVDVLEEDGREERKKGRGKAKTDKKARQNKAVRDVAKDEEVRRREHWVDDDSFVIEKICKYDEVSKYADDKDGARSKRGRRKIIPRETVQQHLVDYQIEKALSIDDTLGKHSEANEKKPPAKSGEKEVCSDDAVPENPRRTKVKANRKYLREKKVEKSRANSLSEEKEGDSKASGMNSKTEVNTDGQVQHLVQSDNERRIVENGDDKTAKKDPVAKILVNIGNNRKKESKEAAVLCRDLGTEKPVPAADDDKVCVSEEEYGSNEGRESVIIDMTGRASLGSCYDSEARLQNKMSTTKDFSYHLNTIELDESCQTEKCDSTFTVDENGHSQTNEKEESSRDVSGYEPTDHSSRENERDRDSSLIVREDRSEEGNCGERECDSTFTIEENDQKTQTARTSATDRGSSVSSTEDVDLKNEGKSYHFLEEKTRKSRGGSSRNYERGLGLGGGGAGG